MFFKPSLNQLVHSAAIDDIASIKDSRRAGGGTSTGGKTGSKKISIETEGHYQLKGGDRSVDMTDVVREGLATDLLRAVRLSLDDDINLLFADTVVFADNNKPYLASKYFKLPDVDQKIKDAFKDDRSLPDQYRTLDDLLRWQWRYYCFENRDENKYCDKIIRRSPTTLLTGRHVGICDADSADFDPSQHVPQQFVQDTFPELHAALSRVITCRLALLHDMDNHPGNLLVEKAGDKFFLRAIDLGASGQLLQQGRGWLSALQSFFMSLSGWRWLVKQVTKAPPSLYKTIGITPWVFGRLGNNKEKSWRYFPSYVSEVDHCTKFQSFDQQEIQKVLARWQEFHDGLSATKQAKLIKKLRYFLVGMGASDAWQQLPADVDGLVLAIYAQLEQNIKKLNPSFCAFGQDSEHQSFVERFNLAKPGGVDTSPTAQSRFHGG